MSQRDVFSFILGLSAGVSGAYVWYKYQLALEREQKLEACRENEELVILCDSLREQIILKSTALQEHTPCGKAFKPTEELTRPAVSDTNTNQVSVADTLVVKEPSNSDMINFDSLNDKRDRRLLSSDSEYTKCDDDNDDDDDDAEEEEENDNLIDMSEFQTPLHRGFESKKKVFKRESHTFRKLHPVALLDKSNIASQTPR